MQNIKFRLTYFLYKLYKNQEEINVHRVWFLTRKQEYYMNFIEAGQYFQFDEEVRDHCKSLKLTFNNPPR